MPVISDDLSTDYNFTANYHNNHTFEIFHRNDDEHRAKDDGAKTKKSC